ncbi:uncharacterized protein LOC116338571 [Contarinia nasturtii]|uniref:uncharacterized protein LOC116338571 n=1 Tax=Contarinia nasturtii TaxID=265458 RepID=UPI0012D43390|nr:uncharacterized protein LOC116338571 [Contarinia nasturtii]
MNCWCILNYLVVLLLLSESAYGAQSSAFRERAKKYCRLTKKCKVREEKDYDYKKLMKISDIPGIQPSGYLVRLPFYVLAPRDAHIVFSPTEFPNWTRDNVYEILVGGWANNRTLIRRKRQDYDMTVEYNFNILRKDNPLKLLIEISNEGKIQVFIEYQKEPLAVAEDKNVLPVKYFGFASYDNSLAKFFYNCEGENAYQEEDIKKLCRYADATENEYKEFYKITDLTGVRSEGYIINFPFYIQAERDAHVLLTAVPMANREANEYEILIGGWANQRVIVRRKQGANVLREIQLVDILAPDKWIAFLIQITTRGDIRIFRKEDTHSFTLMAEANDPEPLPVEYISFGSWNSNLVKFYFNCSFSFAIPDAVFDSTDHPLLARDVPASVDLRNFLVTKCGYYSISDYDYRHYVKISDIKQSQPDGYILRIILYIQGARDANILLTTSDHPNFERDFVYEIVIGGWSNERVVIRKKKGANVLAEAYESRIINQEKPTKMLLEVANSGNIRLYSEKLKSQPIITVLEENPLPIQYISFSSFENSEVQFFYNCSHIDTSKYIMG